MLRRWYCFLLRMHPPYFRQRFGDEMLSIFDATAADRTAESTATPDGTAPHGKLAALQLLADCVISLGRQWILRPDFWEQPARAAEDGIPHFHSFENYKPRGGALIYGVLLSVATFTLFCITFNYGIHE